ncbi:hypothetical protein L486_03134 [Kwoniella mangroviensis CBS 10435]|uniref:Uncharacterized protein n=1 Tax=Kwoniella mangroviensis CBS 10435 TaxID=1331196 RepID=A0A1B9ISZ1_9TREE|nr:hypothetical protein L486_03134 [Kwoniella mangroviensis CBS 10435]
MSLLSEGMNEVPYRRYAYGNHAESERLYFLASIGPRYDKRYADANLDMSQLPKACETWALKSKSDGRIKSVMFFLNPKNTYSDESVASSLFTASALTVAKMSEVDLGNTKTFTDGEVKSTCRLINVIGGRKHKYPVWLYTTDGTTEFYEKAKLRENSRKEVNTESEAVPLVTMTYLPEGWEDVADVKP